MSDTRGLVTPEMVAGAVRAFQNRSGRPAYANEMRAALEAAASDLAKRLRRECAEELQVELRRSPSTPRVAAERVIRRWSTPTPPSGAGEEGGT